MFGQEREEHVEDVDMTHKVREQSPSRVEAKRKEEPKKNPKREIQKENSKSFKHPAKEHRRRV